MYIYVYPYDDIFLEHQHPAGRWRFFVYKDKAREYMNKYDIGKSYRCFYDPKHLDDVSMRAPAGTWYL